MSGSMFQLESSNIQNILIALVVICAIVYGFIEFRKVNMKLDLLESKLSKIIQPMEMHPMEMHMMDPPPAFQGTSPEEDTNEGNISEEELLDTKENNVNFSEPLIDKIINQVENDVIKESANGPANEPAVKEPVKEPVKESVNESNESNESNEQKGIFVSIMTKPSNTIDITEDERIVDLDELDETIEDMDTSYIPSDNNEDPIPELYYEEHTIKDLKSILEEKGLATTGSRTKLIGRIISSKK